MAETIVMKFGGTSVGSAERINAVAKRVVEHIGRTGDSVVLVVSAMGGETDRLIELCRKVSSGTYEQREYHQLVTSGEQASSALTAMALQREGQAAKSLLAHQLGIKTFTAAGQHLIKDIDASILKKYLDEGIVPVVAGFQGIDADGSYTTLGRGGSDTTGVALAAALGPCRCLIRTDIDGVYSALPSICKRAKKLKYLTYEEMLELASGGAKVLQARSVSLAKKYKVPLVVCSSFSEEEGTEIVEEYPNMEDAVVSGITCRSDEAKITLRNLPDKPGVAARVFSILGDAGVVIDMIVQSQGAGNVTAISCTVPQGESAVASDALNKLCKSEMPEATVELDSDIAKLSIVGEGMRNQAGVTSRMFEVLGNEGINIEMITTSEIKISVAIQEKYSELAVRALHEEFLEKE